MSENKMGKKILIQVPSPFAANNAIFEQDANNMTEPWRVLKARLNSLGYEVLTADNNSLEDCEWLLFIDSLSLYGTAQRGGFKNFARRISNKIFKVKDKNPWPNRPLYEEAMARGMENRMALFLWEGAVVSPYNYMPKTWKKFNRIFTWKDDLVDNKKFFKFYLPTPTQNGIVKPLPFAQKKLLVNISANKWYPGENELFSARVRTSLYFDRHYPNDFDHFGARWHTAVTRWQKYFPALYQNLLLTAVNQETRWKHFLNINSHYVMKTFLTIKVILPKKSLTSFRQNPCQFIGGHQTLRSTSPLLLS